MSRRSLYTSQTTTESNSIYQSFTDLMSNAFMIFMPTAATSTIPIPKTKSRAKKSQ